MPLSAWLSLHLEVWRWSAGGELRGHAGRTRVGSSHYKYLGGLTGGAGQIRRVAFRSCCPACSSSAEKFTRVFTKEDLHSPGFLLSGSAEVGLTFKRTGYLRTHLIGILRLMKRPRVLQWHGIIMLGRYRLLLGYVRTKAFISCPEAGGHLG